MTIAEGVKRGYKTFTHPQLTGGRITVYIADQEKGYTGPWATVEDAATDAGVLEPPKVPIFELPDDGEWQPYEPTNVKENNHG